MKGVFPLYEDDGVPEDMALTARQLESVAEVRQKLLSGVYEMIPCRCLCGNAAAERDVVLSRKDRYGLPLSSLICSKCGLVRSAEILSPPSMAQFYQQEYRVIYSDPAGSPESLFNGQVVRGRRLLDCLTSKVGRARGLVFEVGCGAGGILAPFRKAGYDVAGCDYEESYLEYGRSQGLRLHSGGHESMQLENDMGVVVLSHVLEHFANPIAVLIAVVQRLNDGGYLLVEVPGVLRIHEVYFNPLAYLQGAHVYSYTAQHLRVLFESMNLVVVSGDEKCVFIVKKPAGWTPGEPGPVFRECLSCVFRKVKRYVWVNHVLFSCGIHPFFWVSKVAEALGFKTVLTKAVDSLRVQRKTA